MRQRDIYGTPLYKDKRMRNWRRRGVNIASYEQYEELLAAQENKCAICGAKVNGNGCLDHDHRTGIPRGILCKYCNLGLGHLEFNIQSAVDYLLAHRKG